MDEKYKPVELPHSPREALSMADERIEWAVKARDNDKHGIAREFELTALLLRFYANNRSTR